MEIKGIAFALIFCAITIFNMDGIECVSFGSDCTIATNLRKLGIRINAYPFDWIFSGFEPLRKALLDDFNYFLNPDSLIVGDDGRIIIDYYGFGFVHDFPTVKHEAAIEEGQFHEWAEVRHDWRDYIESIREKYQRRIDRLKALFNSSNSLIIFRSPLYKNESITLRDILLECYPQANFILVAISPYEEAKEDWNLDHIKNYYLSNEELLSLDNWKMIFVDLGLIDSVT